jgi:tRNA (guanine37-N1)-methyltransferase
MSGHHEKIRAWRRQKAEETTRLRRPDLWAVYQEHKARVGAKN